MSRYCLMILTVVIQSSTLAQDRFEELEAYFSKVRSGHAISIPASVSHARHAGRTLMMLVPFLADTSKVVRSSAYAIAQLAGSAATGSDTRQDAVSKLVGGLKDPDPGNVGQAIRYLRSFEIADFSITTKDTLVNIFKRKSPHFDHLIKLIGYLQITQVRDDLRALAQSGATPRNERWAALLALARMGDTYAIDDIIARVRRFPVNDEVVYQIFPDLVYTRQRPLFDILITALNSDEKNCETANPNNTTKISCAYRIMEMIAPAVEGYPYKTDESGDIVTDNYEEALTTIREWFRNNSQYTLSTNSY